MDKQKQIEEIEENRVAELRLFYDFCKYNGCEEKTAEDCERCYFNKVYFRLAELEGDIRKGKLKEIPENAVVLTREQYEKDLAIERELGERKASRARKETAEKFAEMLKERSFDEYDPDGRCYECVAVSDIDEICKEIKEGKL